MDATATDIPWPFDVVINGKGYILATGILPSLPFRTQRANYGFSPIFLNRTNVGPNYGDDTQDFFLTAAQNDFSLGQGQKYFRSTDPDSIKRFWQATSGNVDTPGEFKMEQTTDGGNEPGFVAFRSGAPLGTLTNQKGVLCTDTTLYTVDGTTSTLTSVGAHGAATGVQGPFGVTSDGVNVYIMSSAAKPTTIRKWDGTTFTTFSAAANSDCLIYHNNQLYGVGAGTLWSYSTAGVEASVFPWKDAAGTALPIKFGRPLSWGGKLLIPLNANEPAVWMYDGTNTTKIIQFPHNFVVYDSCVADGLAFFSGQFFREYEDSSVFHTQSQGAVYVWDGNQLDVAWQDSQWYGSSTGAASTAASGTASVYFAADQTQLCNWGKDIIINAGDSFAGTLKYTVATGAIVNWQDNMSVSTLGGMFSCGLFLVSYQGSAWDKYPKRTRGTQLSTLFVTSLFDFDSSLPKLFRGVKINWDHATNVFGNLDGDGGSMSLSYLLDSLDAAPVGLANPAVSGQEYLIPNNTEGHSIAVQVVLDPGTSKTGPRLTKVSVRAAPVLTRFRHSEYVIDATGVIEGGIMKTPVFLRNGQQHADTGKEMVDDLVVALEAGIIEITDRLGSFMGMIEPENLEVLELRPDEFYVHMTVREV